jgi:integrase
LKPLEYELGTLTPASSLARCLPYREQFILDCIRLHDLRHTHATLLLKAGVPVHVVAARLGHADPSVTLRVYAHVLADQDNNAATAFAAMVDADNNIDVQAGIEDDPGPEPETTTAPDTEAGC